MASCQRARYCARNSVLWISTRGGRRFGGRHVVHIVGGLASYFSQLGIAWSSLVRVLVSLVPRRPAWCCPFSETEGGLVSATPPGSSVPRYPILCVKLHRISL